MKVISWHEKTKKKVILRIGNWAQNGKHEHDSDTHQFSFTDIYWAKTLPLSLPPRKSQGELENLQRIKIDDQRCRSTRENLMTISLRKVKMQKRTFEMALHVIILLSLLLLRMYFWSETPDYQHFVYLKLTKLLLFLFAGAASSRTEREFHMGRCTCMCTDTRTHAHRGLRFNS